MTKPTIDIDLYRDWIQLLRDELVGRGYPVPDDDPPQAVAFKCFSARLRAIDCRPRTVYQAKSLICDADYASAIRNIEALAASGGDLKPHLSKYLLKSNFHDPLLNDWGIHHLHLGNEQDGSGFIKRTGPLLFAHVTPESLYLIAVKDHDAWTDIDLLETILANWPELLDRCELRNSSGSVLTQPELKALRKKNMQVALRLSNGRAYLPMGGGSMCSGVNMRFVIHHDRFVHFLTEIENDIRSNLNEKRAQLPHGKSFGSPPTFKLQLVNGAPIVLETTAIHGYWYPLSSMTA